MHHRSHTKTHLHTTSHFKKKQLIKVIWYFEWTSNRLSVSVCSGVWCDTFLILKFMNWDPTRCARGWPWDHHLSANVVGDAGLELLNYSTSGAHLQIAQKKHRMVKLDNWPTNIYTPKTTQNTMHAPHSKYLDEIEFLFHIIQSGSAV